MELIYNEEDEMTCGNRSDLRNTIKQMANPQPSNGDKNWLGHGINTSAARIDELLLTGATKKEMAQDLIKKRLAINEQKAISRIEAHLNALKSPIGGNNAMAHGLPLIQDNDERWHFDLKKMEQITGNVSTDHKPPYI